MSLLGHRTLFISLFVIVVDGRYGFETFWRIHRINLNKVAGGGVGWGRLREGKD